MFDPVYKVLASFQSTLLHVAVNLLTGFSAPVTKRYPKVMVLVNIIQALL
jgi:hypothetical protein